jgi:hypothetical protein
VGKKPKERPRRALTDESELSDDDLDRIIGGAGLGAEGQDENDGWSRVVDDHFVEIPAKSPAPGPRRDGSDKDQDKR